MKAITYESIGIQGIQGIIGVENLKLSVKANEHAKVELSLLLEEGAQSALSSISPKHIVSIVNKLDQAFIFQGYVACCRLEVDNTLCRAYMELISTSIDLENEKYSRSFQDTGETYAAVAKSLQNDIPGCKICTSSNTNVAIGVPIVQYEETDWEFLIRIASYLNVSVVPDVTSAHGNIFFDVLPSGKMSKVKCVEFTYGLSPKYYELGGRLGGFSKSHFQYYKFAGYENLNIGDSVELNGYSGIVCEKRACIKQSELRFEYVVGSGLLLAQNRSEKLSLCGLTLRGKVIGVSEDKVKLHLDIDKEQSKSGAYEFDWVPTSGNHMYCMPVEGTYVNLYLCEANMASAKAISCVRTNGDESAFCSQPVKKYFMANGTKSVLLDAKNITFDARSLEDALLKIDMLDNEYISFDTAKKIRISATWKVKAGTKDVAVTSPVHVQLQDSTNKDSTVIVDNTVEIKSKTNVVTHAEERFACNPINDAPVVVQRNWLKLLCKIVVAVVVVAVAAAIVVGTGGAAGPVVAGIVLAGAAYGGITTYQKYKDDKAKGIDRDGLDYLYMFLDNTCTGAIVAAPFAIPGVGFFAGLWNTALASFLYQGVDFGLDCLFGGDFYDTDHNPFVTCVTDVFCGALGYGIANVISKGMTSVVKGLGESWSKASADAIKAFIRDNKGTLQSFFKSLGMGLDGASRNTDKAILRSWVASLVKAPEKVVEKVTDTLWYQMVSNGVINGTVTDVTSGGVSAVNNPFGGIFTDYKTPPKPKTFFKFNNQGELIYE